MLNDVLSPGKEKRIVFNPSLHLIHPTDYSSTVFAAGVFMLDLVVPLMSCWQSSLLAITFSPAGHQFQSLS
jgi:hypothetical protein